MTPIHILFAKLLVKMFMSLKYIHLLHVSTSLDHPQVIFFFNESIALHAHIITRTLKYAFVYLFLVLRGKVNNYPHFCFSNLFTQK
jgi:hypothetical protein